MCTEWLSTPVFLPREFNGLRSLVGYSPWSGKELNTTERLKLSLSLWCTETWSPKPTGLCAGRELLGPHCLCSQASLGVDLGGNLAGWGLDQQPSQGKQWAGGATVSPCYVPTVQGISAGCSSTWVSPSAANCHIIAAHEGQGAYKTTECMSQMPLEHSR